jgi:hypothetical protein
MPKRRVKERRKRAQEFKRLIQVHGGRKRLATAPAATAHRQQPPQREQTRSEEAR